MKKLTATFLTILMMFSLLTASVYAVDMHSQERQKTSEIEVPILTVPDDISGEEAVAYVSENAARGVFIDGWATYALVRKSSDSEKCDLLINWSGEMASAFRCKKVEIKSTSLLFPETYDESGDGSTYTRKSFVASTLASVTFGAYEVPTDVEKATVKIKSGQIYVLSNASWASAAKSSYTTDIE